ncbi:MAG: helix-turn-helix domain-containing protein [Acidimicrobiales bacterium]
MRMADVGPRQAGTESGIGVRLRATRDLRGWSRETLAHHAGVSWSAIAQIESGRRREVRPTTLRALCAALDVDVAYLLGEGTPANLLTHTALPFGGASPRAFVTAVATHAIDGVRHRGAVVVTTSTEHGRALATELARHRIAAHWTARTGELPQRPARSTVTLVDMAAWGGEPLPFFEQLRTLVDSTSDEMPLWVICEPLATARSAEHARRWLRMEALFNVAFASRPLFLACSYDQNQDAAADMLRSHPTVLDENGPVENLSYEVPEAVLLGP